MGSCKDLTLWAPIYCEPWAHWWRGGFDACSNNYLRRRFCGNDAQKLTNEWKLRVIPLEAIWSALGALIPNPKRIPTLCEGQVRLLGVG